MPRKNLGNPMGLPMREKPSNPRGATHLDEAQLEKRSVGIPFLVAIEHSSKRLNIIITPMNISV